MHTYRLTLEYDGSRYHGWQEQRRERTVAGELRRSVVESTGEDAELGGSGRTDAGVHALGQVAHLRLQRAVAPERLRDALNQLLPADIHVLRLERAAPRFHARHAALSRSYLYQVSRRRTAFAKRFVWWVREPLAADAMRAAAAALVGRRDFAPFCERAAEQTSTLVEVGAAEVAEEGALVLVRLEASHFLWKMVRRVVGTLVRVGAGEVSAAEFGALVAGGVAPRAGKPAQWTAPPSGLFLERVLYPGDEPPGPLRAAVPVAAE